MNELMGELYTDALSNRNMLRITFENHLSYFTRQLVNAAEHDVAHTIYEPSFVMAVGGSALFMHYPLRATARQALRDQEGLKAVANRYPYLADNYLQTDWRQLRDHAWETARSVEEALVPTERTVTDYAVMLDGLRNHTITYGRVRRPKVA